MFGPEVVEDLLPCQGETRLGEKKAKERKDFAPHLPSFDQAGAHVDPNPSEILDKDAFGQATREAERDARWETVSQAPACIPE